MPEPVDDFIPDLRRVMGELDDASAQQLDDVLSCAWTTSSEMLGEIGLAIRRVEGSTTPLSPSVRAAFKRALREIHKVWPHL